jgi:N6-adenosine-specific RNA methylase IME4
MDLPDIKALPVATLAAADCTLFLWVTKPMLPAGLEVMAAWGFEYKTVAFTWAKLNKRADPQRLTSESFFMGMGYWTRANAEFCLLGTRGQPTRLARNVRELVTSPLREHSRKPDEVRSRVSQLVPGPYLELFARESAIGWDSWGDQAGLFDDGPIKTRRQPSDLSKVGRPGEGERFTRGPQRRLSR